MDALREFVSGKGTPYHDNLISQNLQQTHSGKKITVEQTSCLREILIRTHFQVLSITLTILVRKMYGIRLLQQLVLPLWLLHFLTTFQWH